MDKNQKPISLRQRGAMSIFFLLLSCFPSFQAACVNTVEMACGFEFDVVGMAWDFGAGCSNIGCAKCSSSCRKQVDISAGDASCKSDLGFQSIQNLCKPCITRVEDQCGFKFTPTGGWDFGEGCGDVACAKCSESCRSMVDMSAEDPSCASDLAFTAIQNLCKPCINRVMEDCGFKFNTAMGWDFGGGCTDTDCATCNTGCALSIAKGFEDSSCTSDAAFQVLQVACQETSDMSWSWIFLVLLIIVAIIGYKIWRMRRNKSEDAASPPGGFQTLSDDVS